VTDPTSAIQNIRSDMADKALVFSSITVLPALALSLNRISDGGWVPVMALHILVALIIIGSAIFRGKISLTTRGVILIGVFLLVSAGGYLNYGLMGAGRTFSFFGVIIALSLFGLRASLITLALSLLILLVSSFNFLSGNIILRESLSSYHSYQSTWTLAVVTMVFVSGTSIALVSGLLQGLTNVLKELELSNNELEIAYSGESKKNEEKTNFLSIMSHEIRTPLNGILGIARLLQDTRLDEQQKPRVDTIISSGKDLLGILNNVLDVNKIESGVVKLECVPTNLSKLVYQTINNFEYPVRDKGLDLISNIEIDPELTVLADPTRIQQIIANLISNSIKFTEQGHIKVICSQIYHAEDKVIEEKDTVICLSVRDTGKGIKSTNIGSIFDLFEQEDNTITRQYGGTGLGLTITKQFAELMGGSIEVLSEINKGTTFNVYIPFNRATETLPDLAHTDANREKFQLKLSILLVEDTRLNAYIAKAFLEKMGHTVELAENGKIAVDFVMEKTFDLIFMDIHMPVMDGVEATTIIREKYSSETLPIIGLTADAFSDNHIKFKNVGMNEILTKPFDKDDLENVLMNLFSH
jgi:signal transduction histidine kinase